MADSPLRGTDALRRLASTALVELCSALLADDADTLRICRVAPIRRKRPVSLHEPVTKTGPRGERRRGLGKLQSHASEDLSQRREAPRRLEKVRSQDYSVGGEAGRPEPRPRQPEGEAERQRQEEEFQTRYRSDPNLARYPVKPQPEEQEMRIHAKVSKARHERRHSDVAINEVGLQPNGGPGASQGRPSRRAGGEGERKAPLENHRSYSVDRTVGGPASKPNHGPQLAPALRTGPQVPAGRPDLRKNHLEPSSAAVLRKAKREKMESMLRNDSLSSDQSESLRPPPPRPHKTKRGVNKRQMSVSSSEEEGGSTPEYTSCEDVEIESVSERGTC